MTGERQKRAALLCDLSCAGRCSASAALPVLSAAGLECALLPTMLLSAHTGFPGAVKQPEADFMRRTAAHWKALGLTFDIILVGYLGAPEALEAAEGFVADFRTDDTLLVVDPAMGDGGRLYGGYTADYPARLARLAARADVLLPNATEAALLLGSAPDPAPGRAQTSALLGGLCALGPRRVAVTGLCFDEGRIAVAARDGQRAFTCDTPRVPRSFFGTGDLFAAVLTAALARGASFETSVRAACDFTALCAGRTAAAGGDARFGVRFEDSLGELIGRLRDL
ncbi:MAG: PfkB family carbohydrate kinase [Oscillospiraceae bacterium]|nr:PfkB family carbohydrate kinase [Oscillospiraceae bacterium]